MTDALIVVDVQNDFCEGGSLAVEGGNAVAEGLASWFDEEDERVRNGGDSTYFDRPGNFWRVYVTRDWHMSPGSHFAANIEDDPDFVDTWPVHCVAATRGAQLHPALTKFNAFPTFYKGMTAAAYSGFEGVMPIGGVTHFVTLEQALRGANVNSVDIVGLATDYCVKATAIDAAKRGFQTDVFSGYVAAVHPDKLDETVAEYKAAGVRWL